MDAYTVTNSDGNVVGRFTSAPSAFAFVSAFYRLFADSHEKMDAGCRNLALGCRKGFCVSFPNGQIAATLDNAGRVQNAQMRTWA